ncbi:alpha/beta fold hydrolase [Shewanella sedimentimangrovi]|uniref:Alpha/beta fold hydrolase n=1 Tax=Shewanella sedimentimangrovi TaxID=2814293 RepID=A0ABX7R5X8_9GAMM|nr:alpha/beta fold hydrolase [Shewanella sedimentimangrovi]QSX38195.1 alpha/beta fold hydrolase [Shewanella sedimentimangrovi]
MKFRFILGLCCFITQLAMATPMETKFFDAGGTKLEYLDLGAGEYTLVIESGVGMGVDYWQPLLPELEKLQLRTVIYSRAGNGKSQAADDVSLAASNERLQQLLTGIKAGNKLLLLGHSYGGLQVRTFAAAHGDSVKGLLLLEPSHEGFGKGLAKLDKAWAERDAARLDAMLNDQAEWRNLQQIYRQNAIADEGITQKLPTVVATSSKLNESDWWIGHSAGGKKLWRELHQSLIAHNPNALHLVTNSTDHNVPLDNCPLLLRAIDNLMFLIHD